MTKKTASSWMSKYCRLRDAIEYCKEFGIDLGQFNDLKLIPVKCCSCSNVRSWPGMDGGHFYSRGIGGGSGAYFDERNVHAQCRGCNSFRDDSKIQYIEHMRALYDQKVLDELAVKHRIPLKENHFAIGLYYKERYEELLKDLE